MTPDVVDEIKANLDLALTEAWDAYYKALKPAWEARREAIEQADYAYVDVTRRAWRQVCEDLDGAMAAFHRHAEIARNAGNL